MRIMHKALAAAVGTAMLASPVNAACWSDAAYKAAQVRELDTMLMVEALRCRKTAANFVGDYNRFVVASRPALLKANAALRGHFAAQVGERGALNAYDNYMTTVANRYGAGSEGLDCRDIASIVRAALATNGSAERLHEVAVTAQMVPTIRGGRCGGGGTSAVTIAARR
jgi:hypothetical protein